MNQSDACDENLIAKFDWASPLADSTMKSSTERDEHLRCTIS